MFCYIQLQLGILSFTADFEDLGLIVLRKYP